MTSATAPIATSGASFGPDYGSGGNRIGRPTNNVYPLLLQSFSGGGSASFHIVTFNLDTLAVAKRMDCPGNNRDLARAFSFMTPGVLFTVDGAVIHKWEVSGAAPVEVMGGGFPKNLAANLHGDTFFTWLQVSADDRWFTMRPGYSGAWIVSWDSQTNTVCSSRLFGAPHPKV